MSDSYCVVVRVNAGLRDQHSARIEGPVDELSAVQDAVNEAMDLANPDERSRIDYAVVACDDPGWARFHRGPYWSSVTSAMAHKAPDVDART